MKQQSTLAQLKSLIDDDEYDLVCKNNMKVNLHPDDLVIWPLEEVQQNFNSFIAKTKHLSMTQADSTINFPNDVEWPGKINVEEMFSASLSKIQGRQNKKKWKDDEKQLLTCLIIRYCLLYRKSCKDLNDEDWRELAKLIVGRNATQCKYKWLARSKFKLVQVPWSPEEDEALIFIYQEYLKQGKHSKWSEIAKEIALRCKRSIVRQGKQCRERWINKLDPQISKVPWNKEEELGLLLLIVQKGKKWSEISKTLSNSRTENSLKNRFHTIIKKEKNKHPIPENVTQEEVIDLVLKYNLNKSPENLIHLYEDIDPVELKIIINIIERLSIQFNKPLAQLQNTQNFLVQKSRNEQQDKAQVDSSVKKVKVEKSDVLEGFDMRHSFNVQMDNVKQTIEDEVRAYNQQDTEFNYQIITKIQHILQPQETDLVQAEFDRIYQNITANQQGEIEFDVEPITNLTDQDLEGAMFGIVDFSTQNLYPIPQQMLQQALSKIILPSQVNQNKSLQPSILQQQVSQQQSAIQMKQSTIQNTNNFDLNFLKIDQSIVSQNQLQLGNNKQEDPGESQRLPEQMNMSYNLMPYPMFASYNPNLGHSIQQNFWVAPYYPQYYISQEKSQMMMPETQEQEPRPQ